MQSPVDHLIDLTLSRPATPVLPDIDDPVILTGSQDSVQHVDIDYPMLVTPMLKRSYALLDEMAPIKKKARLHRSLSPIPCLLPTILTEDKPLTKKFRIANKRYLLTYKTHLCKVSLIKFFNDIAPTTDVVVAHESADDTDPYEHTHVFVCFSSSFQSTNCRVFDYGDIHPNIAPVGRSNLDREKVIRYLSKEDKSNEHLLLQFSSKKQDVLSRTGTTNYAEAVWSCSTRSQVLTLAQRPSDVSGLLALWNNRVSPVPVISPAVALRHSWQSTLWRQIREKDAYQFDRRSVRWVIGANGAEGKSRFVTVFRSNFPADTLVLSQFQGQANSACVIQQAIGRGWNCRVLLVDLPRDAMSHAIYEPLEAIMNGSITATKYQGEELFLLTRPIVIVFANFRPDMIRMSMDRWHIQNIENNELVDEPNYERSERLSRDLYHVDPLSDVTPLRFEED